jgi:hypothetical protein
MFNLRTHFAQVPLEVVQKIVEEQMQEEATSEANQALDDETQSEDVQEAAGGIIAEPLKLSQEESLNQL